MNPVWYFITFPLSMKQYPKIRVIFDRKKQATATKPGTVEIELSLNRERKRYSTKVRVSTREWSEKENVRVKGRPDAEFLNIRIKTMEDTINKYIHKLMIEDKDFSWSAFENFLKAGKSVSKTLHDYIKDKIETKTDLEPSTRKNHKRILRSLVEYQKIQHFEDLTYSNILDYDRWLHEKNYKQTTIASYHKFLKIYINDAIRDELLENNPYKSFKVDRGKPGIRKYLTNEELQQVINVELVDATYCRVRDLFLFQCYTGLAYADLSLFDFSKVISRDGKYVINDVRQKTGEEYYIVLLSPAMEILKKYNFVLPLITNQQYNLRLKTIKNAAKINKNITSHMARHTYASLALNAGVPIEVLAKMLGHSDIKTTQLYAKMFNQTVEKAFEMIEGTLTAHELSNENIKKENPTISSGGDEDANEEEMSLFFE